MCFSARASFLGGGILLAIGMATLKRVKDANQYMFASIPFLFGIQQVMEGFVWLTAGNSGIINTFATYTFLLFALIIWPFWIPLSIFFIEKNMKHKIAIGFLCLMGLTVSVFFMTNLLQHGATSKALCCHIYYHLTLPEYLEEYAILFYLVPTIMPFFISTVSYMWLFGIAALASYIISRTIWSFFLVSVWCFFAAVLSLLVYIIVRNMNKRKSSYIELF